MDLSNTFTVNLPVEDTWRVLTDLERIAPCMPGAALLGVDGDDYQGAVKIKVGPVSAQYRGTARFVERDDETHRAVIRAEGKDVGGQGNAAATITATLSAQGPGTKVDVTTDLALSGRVAQFGRGVIADVSNKLLGQFVQRLEAEVASGGKGTSPTAGGNNGVAPGFTKSIDDVEPLDVMSSMGGTVAKRAVPVLGVLIALIAAVVLARRTKAPIPGGTIPAAWNPAAGMVPLVINLTLPAATVMPAARRHDEEMDRS